MYTLQIKEPYDFALSLKAAASFSPVPFDQSAGYGAAFSSAEGEVYSTAVRVDGQPLVMHIRQHSRDPLALEVTSSAPRHMEEITRIARWVLFADLDLKPFYRLVDDHPLLGPLARRYPGLKPTRPASLFEMAVIAVTEQQISLSAAYRIRARMVERFGDPIEGLWAFPAPQALAQATLEQLQACGLSLRKAEYIRGLARLVEDGSLHFADLVQMSDDEVRAVITSIRGFGRWSADYILVRGLARPDCVPLDDLAVQSVVGKFLGDGTRLTAARLEGILEPFRPYRGIVAFYLLVDQGMAKSQASVNKAAGL